MGQRQRAYLGESSLSHPTPPSLLYPPAPRATDQLLTLWPHLWVPRVSEPRAFVGQPFCVRVAPGTCHLTLLSKLSPASLDPKAKEIPTFPRSNPPPADSEPLQDSPWNPQRRSRCLPPRSQPGLRTELFFVWCLEEEELV